MEGELLKTAIKRPVTRLYPFEKRKPVEGLRGKHVWNPETCIGCGLCERECPSFAIEMIGKGMTAGLDVYLDRCMFCGICEEVCPRDAIKLTDEYELATYSREDLILRFRRPETESKQG